MGKYIRLLVAAFCLLSACAEARVSSYDNPSTATVSLTLPANWRDGETVTVIDGYVRISAPRLVTPSAPVAAPSLPVYVFEVDLPKDARVEDIVADVEWSDVEQLHAPALPIAESVSLPERPTIPAPDPEIAALSAYPTSPAENGGTHLMRGRARLAVRLTPYLYNPQEYTTTSSSLPTPSPGAWPCC